MNLRLFSLNLIGTKKTENIRYTFSVIISISDSWNKRQAIACRSTE